jgi:hypothetical protein
MLLYIWEKLGAQPVVQRSAPDIYCLCDLERERERERERESERGREQLGL